MSAESSLFSLRFRTSKDRASDTSNRCPDDGRYGIRPHLVIEGRCYTCEGEEAARRARLEEKGIFLGR